MKIVDSLFRIKFFIILIIMSLSNLLLKWTQQMFLWTTQATYGIVSKDFYSFYDWKYYRKIYGKITYFFVISGMIFSSIPLWIMITFFLFQSCFFVFLILHRWKGVLFIVRVENVKVDTHWLTKITFVDIFIFNFFKKWLFHIRILNITKITKT
jgi:hypothetical protein